MSKFIILIALFNFSFSSESPVYAQASLNDFYQKASNQNNRAARWRLFGELKQNLLSEKIIINSPEQLIYMNTLMIALDEVKESEYRAGQCSAINKRLDDKFSVKPTHSSPPPKHYLDAKKVLNTLCQ